MLKRITLFVSASVIAFSASAENHYKGYAPADYTVFSPNQFVEFKNRYEGFSNNPEVYYATSEGRTAAGQLNELSRFIMDQLVQNRDIKNVLESRVAVTSFVMLDDLSKSNKFGVMLAEQMMHQMHVRGFKVVDFKSMPAIEIGEKSDHLMTRDVSKLKNELNIGYSLAGTVSAQGSGYAMNVRLIRMDDQTVVSSAQGFISDRVYKVLNGELKSAPESRTQVVIQQETYPVVESKVMIKQR
jgi:TolB-like protein